MRSATLLLVLLNAAAQPALAFTLQHGACSTRGTHVVQPRCMVNAGLFDMFSESPEQKAAKEAAKEAEFRAQQEMLARRRNPAAMAAYEAEVAERRAAASEKDAELKELQQAGGTEALDKWKSMRAEGKIDAFEKEREAGERSLGGEGLLPDRVDENMPFIDNGYVDEATPDVMEELGKMAEGFGKMFGGDKKK